MTAYLIMLTVSLEALQRTTIGQSIQHDTSTVIAEVISLEECERIARTLNQDANHSAQIGPPHYKCDVNPNGGSLP